MKKIQSLLLMSCLLGGPAQAQSLWGAEANVGQVEGQFGVGFIQTGDPSSLSNTDWTALSIYQSSQSVTPGSAYWTRNLQGYSQGAYFDGTTPVNSPSQADGVALFDSDFLDNNGTAGAFGTGSSPSVHRGELISPPIDLTGNTDNLIMLKFYSYHREFQISSYSISFSTDTGLTWGQAVDIRPYQDDLSEGFIYVPFPEETLEGVANLTQVRFKFVFEGDYYFALVDDVTLMIYDPVVFETIFTNGFEATSP